MFKITLSLFVLFFLFKKTDAQIFPFSKEINFVKYLQSKGQYASANSVLQKIDTANLAQPQKDSLYYEIAWQAYTQKKLDSAVIFFQKISSADSRFKKASFFASYCQAYTKKFDESRLTLLSIAPKDSVENELRNFELAGLALLQRDYKKYQSYQAGFSFNSYILKQEETNLNKYNTVLIAQRKKSPVVAGVLSAIIPGSGKWYAGKKKQGIAAFLPVISAGFLTLEAYNRGGLKDARFWLYGTVFSTFYIGNIWGSVVSVKIKNQEFNRLYENKILFDMHIPLRNFFN